jgi:hypothetical protein
LGGSRRACLLIAFLGITFLEKAFLLTRLRFACGLLAFLLEHG